MEITDLTPTLLNSFDVLFWDGYIVLGEVSPTLLNRHKSTIHLIPLRKINYQDVQIGDIMVNSNVDWTAIQITNKNIERGSGEEMLTYDVYHINDDKVVLDVKGHNFPYQGLVTEKWKYLKIPHQPIIALNYPEEILNSRTDN